MTKKNPFIITKLLTYCPIPILYHPTDVKNANLAE
jgi:hypothetical protein